MATFVQVGNNWVNVELVTSIELVPDPHDPVKIAAARIHYTTGKQHDFTAAADIQGLTGWLRARKAQ